MKLRSLNHDHWAIEILQSKFKNYLALPIKIGKNKAYGDSQKSG